MPVVDIYTKSWCSYCTRVKALLNELGVTFNEIDVTDNPVLEQEMVRLTHRTSVPQIFFNGHHVGGSDDLAAVVASGEYDRLVEAASAQGATSETAARAMSYAH